MAEPRRAGPPAALSVLGAGAGWGAVTGVVAGAVIPAVGADDLDLTSVPAALLLGLVFGSPIGVVLGLGLALLPAMTVGLVRSPRSARVTAAITYGAMAVLLVSAVLIDMETAPPLQYAALYAAALLFGLWRCQRSAACAVERVERRRAAPPIARPGVPLDEPGVQLH